MLSVLPSLVCGDFSERFQIERKVGVIFQSLCSGDEKNEDGEQRPEQDH